MAAPSYDYYFAALAFQAGEGPKPEAHFNSPQPGFYRTTNRDGEWQPVAIWADGEDLVATRDGKDVDPGEIWDFVVGKEVPEDLWRAVVAGEKDWPDSAPGIGHNNPAEEIEKDPLKRIAQILPIVDKFIDVTLISSKDVADQAAEYVAELLRLKGDVEDLQKAESASPAQAVKDIREKFKPSADEASIRVEKLREALTKFMVDRDLERVGSRGRAVTLRKYDVPVFRDYGAALQHYAADDKIKDALLKLIAADLKKGKTIPGVATTEEKKAQ